MAAGMRNLKRLLAALVAACLALPALAATEDVFGAFHHAEQTFDHG